MTVELIREIVDYLDEDYNPVKDENQARYVSTTTFDNDGNIENQTIETILKSEDDEDEGYAEAPDITSYKKLGKPFDEKSDTGDDHSRTGPGGLNPRDDYDSINYQGQSDTKVHLATPYFDGKEPHDVSGDVLELKPDYTGPHLEQAFTDDKKIEGSLIVKKYLRFKYNSGKIECKICKPLDGMEFADDDTKRPILPSEGMGEGVFNTHPNCLCTYEPITKYEDISLEPKSDSPQSRAAALSLKDREDVTREHLRPLSESLNYAQVQDKEFSWIPQAAMEEMKKEGVKKGGRFLLAVALGEVYTDHRYSMEKEERRRFWSENEMMQTIRTARRKFMNINHLWTKINPQSGHIFDANWNFETRKGEMILWETDQYILDAIRNDIITAVSMNTGQPRTVKKTCNTNECFDEPQGVVLGEDDNLALAYIVTADKGFKYNGQIIPAMPPGMKFTKIYIIE